MLELRLDHELKKVGLSNRELEVAKVISTGITNQEAANQLFVTEKTVKFHLTNIYKKLKVKSRTQLIIWCMPHMGIIESLNADSHKSDLYAEPEVAITPISYANTKLPEGNA